MQPNRILELFCGIGGVAVAAEGREIVAVDIHRPALEIYRANFRHAVVCRAIESLTVDEVEGWGCDTWWLSPPCQPVTQRGKGRDLSDPRSTGLRRVVQLIDQLKPPRLALENVAPFARSESRNLVCDCLARNGYDFAEMRLCPTEWGWPNRRPRYYLIATRVGRLPPRKPFPTLRFEPRLDPRGSHAEYRIPSDWWNKYREALRVIDETTYLAGDTPTHCFTAAYGRSPVRSGSFLQTPEGVRLFTPREVAWQLGFPEEFQWPDLPPQRLWPRIGNSLSIPAVRYVLSHLLDGRPVA